MKKDSGSLKDILIAILGKSWDQGILGLIVLGFAGVAMWMGNKTEAGSLFAVGIALMKSRSASVTSEEQAAEPGLMNKPPDLPSYPIDRLKDDL